MAEVRGVSGGVVLKYRLLIVFIFGVCQIQISLSDEPSIPCGEENEGEYVRDAETCAVAYVCNNDVTSSSWQWLEINCPDGLWFDLNINSCNEKFMVQCTKECSSNPCLVNGVCSKIPDGYRCSYPNHINGIGDDEFSLLVSQYGTREIFSFDIDDSSFERLKTSSYGQPNVLEYDSDNDKLYIAYENPNAIIVTDLEKSFFTVLKNGVTSEGLLVDSEVDRLFYSDYTKRTINSMTTTGADHSRLVSGLGRPRSVVADKAKQVLYWIDITKAMIESSDYNGKNRKSFLRTSNIPLALDMAIGSDYLYWCDKRGEIWEVSLDGTPRLVHRPQGGTKECDSLAVIRNKVYIAFMLSTDIDVIDMASNKVEQYKGQGNLKYGKYKTVEIVIDSNRDTNF